MAVQPDPKFISFNAVWARHSEIYLPIEVQPVTLEPVTRENHGTFFNEGSFFEYMEAVG